MSYNNSTWRRLKNLRRKFENQNIDDNISNYILTNISNFDKFEIIETNLTI